jgi:hypothetical protein
MRPGYEQLSFKRLKLFFLQKIDIKLFILNLKKIIISLINVFKISTKEVIKYIPIFPHLYEMMPKKRKGLP